MFKIKKKIFSIFSDKKETSENKKEVNTLEKSQSIKPPRRNGLFFNVFYDEKNIIEEHTVKSTDNNKKFSVINNPKKKSVVVFDTKRRVFVTKKRISSVALFCPFKKQFRIRMLDGRLKTILFNPLDDDNFAYPIAGDWFKNGYDGIGLYYPKTGVALLKKEIDNSNKADETINFHTEGEYIPLSGDWEGQGIDSLCFYFEKKSAFLFPKKEGETSVIRFGEKNKHYIPISGDWDNQGQDKVGLYDPKSSVFRLKNTLNNNKADLIFRFGKKDSNHHFLPVSGNWKGDGHDSIGLYEKETGVFRLKDNVSTGKADDIFKINRTHLIPLEISFIE